MKENHTHQAAARVMAQHLNHLKDSGQLDLLTNEELSQKLIDDLLASGFKIR